MSEITNEKSGEINIDKRSFIKLLFKSVFVNHIKKIENTHNFDEIEKQITNYFITINPNEYLSEMKKILQQYLMDKVRKIPNVKLPTETFTELNYRNDDEQALHHTFDSYSSSSEHESSIDESWYNCYPLEQINYSEEEI